MTMKSISAGLFVFAILLLSISLWQGGITHLFSANGGADNYAVAVSELSSRISLKLEGAGNEGARVCVLINGKAVTTFASGDVSLLVRDQDEITIDSDLPKKVRVVVSYSAAEIVLPRAGDHVYLQNTVETLGRVIIRRRNG